jgi:cyclopropane-fatty-acyl-phospholipid synthase
MKALYHRAEEATITNSQASPHANLSTINSKLNPSYSSNFIDNLFLRCGIRLNGKEPYDIQIKNPDFYKKVVLKWSLGLGESYMDGDWDCEKLDELINHLLRQDLNNHISGKALIRLYLEIIRERIFNLQSKDRSFLVGKVHYDVGNSLFEKMLDSNMNYSCAYWEGCNTLEQAQENKLKMICEKLELKQGEKLLEVGCGWGGLAAYAAKNYGVSVLGITISREQQILAVDRCKNLPVDIKMLDYRDLNGKFDKIVSVGMFEHVGIKNYSIYIDNIMRLLDDDGLFLLHTIGSDVSVNRNDPWIDRYIFPNGRIPSSIEICKAIEGKLLIEDWHNFGQDYDKTLMAWYENFIKNWPTISSNYDQRFYRMWTYYLLGCAGFFRSRQGQLWQIVLSKRSRNKVYRSKRLAA